MKTLITIIALIYMTSTPAYSGINCDSTTLTNAINAASTGDTITCNAGSWTWGGSISISKEIKLIGAGIGSTNITCSSGWCIYSDEGAANNVRVSGFTFTYSGGSTYMVIMNGTNWRIDHNRFAGGGGDGEAVVARSNVNDMFPHGLVDNNQMVNVGVLVEGSYAMMAENNMQNRIWSQNPDIGGSDYVYIEDNTFSKTVSGTSNCVDANYGGRYVFRYNTVTASSGLESNSAQYVEAHSIQGTNRATQRWELYGNIFNNQSANTTYYPFRIRGGTGVAIYNNVIGGWSNDGIGFDNIRSYDNVGTGGLCDGDSTWDGNQDATGWPCRDQIGRGYDSTLWVDSPPGAYAQPLMPAYEFLNREDSNIELGVDILNASDNHIVANRDYYSYTADFNGTSGVGCGSLASRPATCTTGVAYWATNQSCSSLTGLVGASPTTSLSGTLYKCTDTNTWATYFTPYTYPHPLRGESSSVGTISNITIGPGVSVR